jgi:hypothetical protein
MQERERERERERLEPTKGDVDTQVSRKYEGSDDIDDDGIGG